MLASDPARTASLKGANASRLFWISIEHLRAAKATMIAVFDLIGFKEGEPGSFRSFYESVIRRLEYLSFLPRDSPAHTGLQDVLVANTTAVLREAEWRYNHA